MYAVAHDEGMIGVANKKRKMMFDDALNFNNFPGDAADINHDSKTLQYNGNAGPLCLSGRRFLTLYKGNCNSVYHTEEWLPCGSTLFSPLTEDIMVNTQNIEQFSSTHGQFCVSDESGQYSTTLTGFSSSTTSSPTAVKPRQLWESLKIVIEQPDKKH